jgi:hypothetical protein
MTPESSVRKDIPGFPGYKAGADGSIWSYRSGLPRLLKPDRRKEDGRRRYTLRSASGRFVRKYGAYFVLLAFKGHKPDGYETCHNDGNCLNDSADNLRWDTHSANLADRRRHGTMVRGEKVHTAKITAKDVLEIRRIGRPNKQHANKFGISEAMVGMIINRRSWRHV